MIKIRGNRIYYTPSTDTELPEGERRVFAFANPSFTYYERLVDRFTTNVDGKQITRTLEMIHAMLRGWTNIRTDYSAIARKFGVDVPEGEDCDDVALPFPVPTKPAVAIDLLELLPLKEWKELHAEVIASVNPVPSGN